MHRVGGLAALVGICACFSAGSDAADSSSGSSSGADTSSGTSTGLTSTSSGASSDDGTTAPGSTGQVDPCAGELDFTFSEVTLDAEAYGVRALDPTSATPRFAVGLTGDDRIDLFESVGGTLTQGTTPLGVGLGPIADFVVVDTNADGADDVVFVFTFSNVGGIATIDGAMNDFRAQTEGVGDPPTHVALAELDGDSFAEFVVGSSNTAAWRIDGDALGPVSGSNVELMAPALAEDLHAIAITDVDGDGLDEIHFATGSGAGLLTTVFPATADPVAERLIIGAPSSAAAIDLDGNPDPDLVLGLSNGLLRLAHTGNPGNPYGMDDGSEAPGGASAVVVADMNCDQIDDVVVTYATSPAIRVFIGDGAGAFAQQLQVGLGANPVGRFFDVGDYDGNGAPDIAAIVDAGGTFELRVFMRDPP